MTQELSAQSKFFADLLQLPEVHGNEILLEGILASSTANTMPEPVQAIIDFKQGELDRLKDISARILGAKTNYLSLDEIKALASRWKLTPEEAQKTIEANRDKFPMDSDSKYYVGPENAHLLARGLEANTFIKAAHTIEIRELEIVELRGMHQSLESRLNEERKRESPVKADKPEDKRPDVKAQSVTENTNSVSSNSSSIYFDPTTNSIWGTSKELFKLGGNRLSSDKSLNTTLYLIKAESKKAEGKDRRRFFKVDETNYKKAGFSTWPPTNLAQLPRKGGSSKGDLEARAESSSPSLPAPATPTPQQTTVKDNYTERLLEPRPRFQIGGNDYSFNPAVSYEVFQVRTVLRKVHPEVFTDAVIDAALQYMGATDSSVTGQALINFLKQVEGMMTFSTGTLKTLERKVGGDFKVTKELLTSPGYAGFVYELPGGIAPGMRFINKHQLDALASSIRTNERVTANSPPVQTTGRIDLSSGDIARARDFYNDFLLRIGISPPNSQVYSNLVNFGVLQNHSAEAIRVSYETFAKEMEGFEFFPYPIMQQKLGLDWKTFELGYLLPLKRAGLIKDLVLACNGKRGGSFYVVQEGKKQEAFDKIRGFHQQQQAGKKQVR